MMRQQSHQLAALQDKKSAMQREKKHCWSKESNQLEELLVAREKARARTARGECEVSGRSEGLIPSVPTVLPHEPCGQGLSTRAQCMHRLRQKGPHRQGVSRTGCSEAGEGSHCELEHQGLSGSRCFGFKQQFVDMLLNGKLIILPDRISGKDTFSITVGDDASLFNNGDRVTEVFDFL